MTVKRKARPDRIRLSLIDDASGATTLALPDRRMWPAGLVLAAMFAIFTSIEIMTIAQMTSRSVDDVFDLMFFLFHAFWVLGWSVGVAILGALTALFLFYRESARLHGGKLVYVPRIGPLNILIEYDLSKIRNLRFEEAKKDGNVRVRFDYGDGSAGLGDSMRRSDAERLVGAIQNAATAAGLTARAPEGPRWDPRPSLDPTPAAPKPVDLPPLEPAPPSILSPSGLALILANLWPLGGVLFFGWDLPSIIILFWAESGIIAFYTALKMAVVGKLFALLAVPFFIGHFGGFMAAHFLLIYAFIVRGVGASEPAPGVSEALLAIFKPLWTSLAALFISHGVSFFSNFIRRREYAGTTMTALMTAPYNRIIVMQLALIFGGWIVMSMHSPVPALAVLVLLKTVLDFSAHRTEHRT